MRRVSAQFVLRLSNDDQKENRVEISQELLANPNGKENFFKNIVRYETWVYRYDVETKMQSSQWIGERISQEQKKHGWIRQRSRCCWLCFLSRKALSIMNLYHVVRW